MPTHQSLLLTYLPNLHILSTSTFAYTARAETSAYRPRGDQCMMLQGLLLMYLPNSHILSTSTFARGDQSLMLQTNTFAHTARAETSA